MKRELGLKYYAALATIIKDRATIAPFLPVITASLFRFVLLVLVRCFQRPYFHRLNCQHYGERENVKRAERPCSSGAALFPVLVMLLLRALTRLSDAVSWWDCLKPRADPNTQAQDLIVSTVGSGDYFLALNAARDKVKSLFYG